MVNVKLIKTKVKRSKKEIKLLVKKYKSINILKSFHSKYVKCPDKKLVEKKIKKLIPIMFDIDVCLTI